MARREILQSSPEFLTTTEASEVLRVAPQTLRRWRCRGSGPPFIKVSNNRVVYRWSAIENFVSDREFSSTSDEAAATALRCASISAA